MIRSGFPFENKKENYFPKLNTIFGLQRMTITWNNSRWSKEWITRLRPRCPVFESRWFFSLGKEISTPLEEKDAKGLGSITSGTILYSAEVRGVEPTEIGWNQDNYYSKTTHILDSNVPHNLIRIARSPNLVFSNKEMKKIMIHSIPRENKRFRQSSGLCIGIRRSFLCIHYACAIIVCILSVVGFGGISLKNITCITISKNVEDHRLKNPAQAIFFVDEKICSPYNCVSEPAFSMYVELPSKQKIHNYRIVRYNNDLSSLSILRHAT